MLKGKAGPQIYRLGAILVLKTGGGSGIRTHDRVAPITVFKTVAFVHSAIPPSGYYTSFKYGIGGLVNWTQ